MTNDQVNKIITIFENAGFNIELGAQYSIKGQVAQLLNGCEILINECAIIAGHEAEKCKFMPDGQRVADAVRKLS